MYIHLNQESLKLTKTKGADWTSTHDGCHVGEDVAQRGQEDQTIDGSVECRDKIIRDHDEGNANEGDDRAGSLDEDNIVELLVGECHHFGDAYILVNNAL